jgi:hypothetical protein
MNFATLAMRLMGRAALVGRTSKFRRSTPQRQVLQDECASAVDLQKYDDGCPIPDAPWLVRLPDGSCDHAYAHTKSEARAIVKRKRHLDRLPAGTTVTRT